MLPISFLKKYIQLKRNYPTTEKLIGNDTETVLIIIGTLREINKISFGFTKITYNQNAVSSTFRYSLYEK